MIQLISLSASRHSRLMILSALLSLVLTPLSLRGQTERVHVSSQGMIAPHGMVASGQRLASDAGVEILKMGGNAVDAGIATAFAMGVVEMGNTSLGGGGALLLWLEDKKETVFIEFYSQAGSSPRESTGSARNVAIPGNAAGLLEAHERYGRLSREAVLAPAIRLASEGFAVPVNLAESFVTNQEKLEKNTSPEALALFYPEGKALQAGDWLIQKELAAVLTKVAAEGKDGFYKGEIAEKLIADLNAHGNPATLEDLAQFRTRWLRPLAGGFRQYTILSAPPPLGGSQVIQPLVLLDAFPLRETGLPTDSPISASWIVDAIRIGRQDYLSYVFDPDSPVPGNGLTSAQYAATRIEEIGKGQAPKQIKAGDPWKYDGEMDPRFSHLNPWPPSERQKLGVNDIKEPEGPSQEHTTHLSVVDADRNAVAITMTLGPTFADGFYSSGIFFNNGLSRFGKTPEENQWAPRRTPRSDTSPTIVLEDDQLRLVTGAQGGPRIPTAIVFNILYALEYKLNASEAMAGPRVLPLGRSPDVHVETGFDGEALTLLRTRGYSITPYKQQDAYFAGAHMIIVQPDGRLHGAADMRRAGSAVGY